DQRRSLIIAGKDIVSYHDINPDQTVRDTFMTRQLLHTMYVNAPTATQYGVGVTNGPGLLKGVRIEPNVSELLTGSGFDNSSNPGLDVDAVQPIFVKNGTSEYAYAYGKRTNIT